MGDVGWRCLLTSTWMTAAGAGAIFFPDHAAAPFWGGKLTPREKDMVRTAGGLCILGATMMCGVAYTRDPHTQKALSQSLACGLLTGVGVNTYLANMGSPSVNAGTMIADSVFMGLLAGVFGYFGFARR